VVLKRKISTTRIELLLLIKGGGRSSDDHWKEVDAEDIRVWEKAETLLRAHTYPLGEKTIEIHFDWAAVTARLREDFRLKSRFYDQRLSNRERELIKFPRRPVRVKCHVTITAKKRLEARAAVFDALSHARSLLYDVFLMLNLAVPGCCSFWTAVLRPRVQHERWMTAELSLSEYSFDEAYFGNFRNKWPAPGLLDVESVVNWYRGIRNGTNQIPENRTQKVFFALMHICKSELSIDTIMWQFYALETFYDTQPGENRRTLTSRAALVLSPDDKQAAYLKKELQRLYNIRSGFAHGGREIAHPINDERLDRRVEGDFRELMEASEFGFALLLTSLQNMINIGCREFDFKETLVRIPVTSSM
jgi:hypothetical protein